MTTPALNLRAGTQLASTVCRTRVVVVRAPADRQPVLGCGGQPMVIDRVRDAGRERDETRPVVNRW
jgi:hypothetical protein